jgi:hypothetical protein
MKRYVVPALAYLVPTFILGYAWHLVLFTSYYERLAMYRRDVVIPLGLASMTIQSLFFAWTWERLAATGAPRATRSAATVSTSPTMRRLRRKFSPWMRHGSSPKDLVARP